MRGGIETSPSVPLLWSFARVLLCSLHSCKLTKPLPSLHNVMKFKQFQCSQMRNLNEQKFTFSNIKAFLWTLIEKLWSVLKKASSVETSSRLSETIFLFKVSSMKLKLQANISAINLFNFQRISFKYPHCKPFAGVEDKGKTFLTGTPVDQIFVCQNFKLINFCARLCCGSVWITNQIAGKLTYPSLV